MSFFALPNGLRLVTMGFFVTISALMPVRDAYSVERRIDIQVVKDGLSVPLTLLVSQTENKRSDTGMSGIANVTGMAHSQDATISFATSRGSLGRSELIQTLGSVFLNSLVTEGYPVSSNVTQVKVYRVHYLSENGTGEMDVVSGAVAVPVFADRNQADPLVFSYQHGTILSNDEAPSEFGDIEFASLAALGHLSCAADYPGYGASKDVLHPYMMKRPLQVTSLDMLVAAQSFFADEGEAHNGHLFLMGYSQGGYATALLQQSLEQNPLDGLVLHGASWGGAPLQVWETIKWSVDKAQLASPEMAAFLMTAYREFLPMTRSYTSIFTAQSGLQNTLPDWFIMDNEEDISGLPSTVADLFQADFVSGITQENDAELKSGFEQNSALAGWTPDAETLIFHSSEDTLVPSLNSSNATLLWDDLVGDTVTEDISTYGDHNAAYDDWLAATLNFFSQLPPVGNG